MSNKRRVSSAQFKVDAVMDLLSGSKSPSAICRERGITDKLLYRWKGELLERLPSVFEQRAREDEGTQQWVAELERLAGRLALENKQIPLAPASQATSSPMRCRKVLGGTVYDYDRDATEGKTNVSARFCGGTAYGAV